MITAIKKWKGIKEKCITIDNVLVDINEEELENSLKTFNIIDPILFNNVSINEYTKNKIDIDFYLSNNIEGYFIFHLFTNKGILQLANKRIDVPGQKWLEYHSEKNNIVLALGNLIKNNTKINLGF